MEPNRFGDITAFVSAAKAAVLPLQRRAWG
ncbi:hypothetical protein JOE27_000856 [Pseudomonas sp. M5]|nr:hypothetical protein [Pseudomonas sp. M5]